MTHSNKFSIRLTREDCGRFGKTFFLLNVGLLLYAVTLNFFCTPNNFVFGGATGLSIVLASVFPGISVGTFMWAANLGMLLLGFLFLGKSVMGWTLYSSVMLSAFCSLFETLWPVTEPITDDPFLELCFAIFLPAAASGLIFNIGASTGGTEIIAMILHKYFGFEIGRALLISDLGIVLWAACLFGPKTGLYCILGVAAKCTIVDTAIESLNLRKVCTIISQKPDEVGKFTPHPLNRTATEESVPGSYTREPKTAIMVALTSRQALQLRDFLRRTDPGAFLTIVNSSEIIGKGFRAA